MVDRSQPSGRKGDPLGYLAYCEGKEQFHTPQAAHAVQRRRTKRGHIGEVYRCPQCGKHHIGRRPDKVRKQ